MSESEITDVYNKMLEDLVRLCRILLNYQMIHGVDAEDIVPVSYTHLTLPTKA